MIDLHLHLDGSLNADMIWRHAKLQQIDLGTESREELLKKLVCPMECQNLDEYLERFDIPLKILQTEDAIREAAEELIGELVRQKILYAEIRFAPQLHTRKGLSQEDTVRSAILGMNNATKDENIKIQFILCCMRGADNVEANCETVELTSKYLHQGVCACDLAGPEALYQTEHFRKLFEYANMLGVPYTIHAGEADGPQSVYTALEFGAKRIGHGVRSQEDSALMEKLRTEHICLECCPTSNVQTKAVTSIDSHPIKKFLDNGLCVTLNTDALTVSGTTIANEVGYVREHLGLSEEEELQLYKNAADSAFLLEEEKVILKNKIHQQFHSRKE